jgi:glycosyltransferase involved in cell wall biosynthesis
LGEKLGSRGEKLKVLHFIESLGSGGAERLLHTNLQHLDRDTFENRVVTVFPSADYWRGPIEDLGVPVSSLKCGSYRELLTGIRRFRTFISADPPDVIHTHLFAANVIGRVAGRHSRVPVISSIHNPEYEPEAVANASVSVRAKVRVARDIDKLTASYGCSRMIAVSRYVKETTAARLGFSPGKIDVIYNPVDLPTEQPNADRMALLETIGTPHDAFVIMTVGRLSPQKGFAEAVRAMPEILAIEPAARLISIGSQADRDYTSLVQREIASLGLADSVHMLGERRDIHSLLAACDVFLFPSLFEGLGIALAEAMVSGRACVASRIRPLDEFVEDGVNGILVDPGSPESIAGAIIGLMHDEPKRRSIGKAAAATARDLFQPEPAARKLEEIYQSVLGK